MPDQYTFTIVLNDSNDEFSENFNPKDDQQVFNFEQHISEILNENNWNVVDISLVQVKMDL